MAKEIIGIDISDTSVEAVVLQKNRAGLGVAAYSRFRLSPDIVSNGRILDPTRLQEAISKLLLNAKPKPILSKKVFLSIPESQTYTRIFSVPGNLGARERRDFVWGQAAEMIPEDPDNLKTIIKILDQRGNFREVLYLAAKKETLASLSKIFLNLDLQIMGICTEAVSSFAGLSDQLKHKVTLLLDIGARTTIATVFNKRGIRDTTNINIAGDNISAAIAQRLGIPLLEAENIKENFSFSAPDQRVGQIIVGQLDLLAGEITKFIAYYQERYNEKIAQVILIGGSAQLKDVGQYFSNKFLLPVIIGQSLLPDNTFPEPLAITKYINAVGLASFAYQKAEINFFDNQVRDRFTNTKLKFSVSRFKKSLLISLAVLVILAALFFIF